MSNKLYTEDHEWIEIADGIVTIGITDFAQKQLGDVVFVELPEANDEVTKGDEVAVIESVKAAGAIHSPVSGVVLSVNEELEEEPDKVNEDPEGKGWFFTLRINNESDLDKGSLMDLEAYLAFSAADE